MFISFLKNIYINTLNKSAFLVPHTPALSCVSRINTASAGNDSESNSLVIAESCVKRLKQIGTDGTFLRITVEGGGCSGFQYRFDLDSKVNEDDVCFNRDGAKIVVDRISLDFLKGSTVEYQEELIRSAFRIASNPQADSKCSCGTSFAVKMP